VLTDLREATASIVFARSLAGHVLVSGRGTSVIVAEVEKRTGQSMRLAVPAGRYLVHLRQPQAVALAEADLPWGGTVHVTERSLTAQSYQSVVQKGSALEIRRQRLELWGGWQSAILSGMGGTALLALGYGWRFAPLELGARVMWSSTSFDTVDSRAQTSILALGLRLAYEQPLQRIDLSVHGLFEESYWRQRVTRLGQRTAFVPAVGVGVGARVPLWRRWFGAAAVEGLLHAVSVESTGRSVRPNARGMLSLGLAL
jgi:hypothetical protein